MRAGHVFRIVTLEGSQAEKFNLWNLHNPREKTRGVAHRPVAAGAYEHIRPFVVFTARSADFDGHHRRRLVSQRISTFYIIFDSTAFAHEQNFSVASFFVR
ncbi:MAG: Aminomethyltransferase (EC [uncultured Paraburkholderia sp.]|nr:MAG: Aminomethyltransferase (EC [uncultured Paraburkholderia sp.]